MMALALNISVWFPQQRCPTLFKPTITKQTLSFPTASAFSSVTQLSVGQDLPANYSDWVPSPDPELRRRCGILLHPTSFRGPYGIGDLGDEAFRFIDWLHHSGCSVWQVLPLVPPGRKANEEGSPYSGQVRFGYPFCFRLTLETQSILFDVLLSRMRIVATRS